MPLNSPKGDENPSGMWGNKDEAMTPTHKPHFPHLNISLLTLLLLLAKPQTGHVVEGFLASTPITLNPLSKNL